MKIDFKRWAVVAHKDDTGFGRMATDVQRVLGIGRHIVIPSERLTDHSLDLCADRLLKKDDPPQRLATALEGLDGIIFFERAAWHPQLLRTARDMKVRTVCVPMWEWFSGRAPEWEFCDLFVCPSQFTENVVRKYGWRNTVVLPWTLDLTRFPARQITGMARRFVHNAGLIDADDRKGTRDTIMAFMRVRNPELRLLVRMQKAAPLPYYDRRVEVQVGNLDDPAELYAAGDCAIQPSKMEGLGFMVLEPVVSGLPVITLDYPPMNECVAQREMLVSKKWFRRRGFPTAWIKHAHLRLPRVSDLARKIAWSAQHDLAEISRDNRLWAEQEYAPSRLLLEWTQTLGSRL